LHVHLEHAEEPLQRSANRVDRLDPLDGHGRLAHPQQPAAQAQRAVHEAVLRRAPDEEARHERQRGDRRRPQAGARELPERAVAAERDDERHDAREDELAQRPEGLHEDARAVQPARLRCHRARG
jgi:hypothetical protein